MFNLKLFYNKEIVLIKISYKHSNLRLKFEHPIVSNLNKNINLV
jgi:hypothetical protein